MSSIDLTSLAPGNGAEAVRPQVAALCWRLHSGRPQVLLITSRDTGRWIVPKGWPIDGKTGAETAAQEAWEEAGVRGRIDSPAIGRFSYGKVISRKVTLPCQVEVFALRVRRLARDYPERDERRRKWFTLDRAARKVLEPELRALLLGFRGTEADLPTI